MLAGEAVAALEVTIAVHEAELRLEGIEVGHGAGEAEPVGIVADAASIGTVVMQLDIGQAGQQGVGRAIFRASHGAVVLSGEGEEGLEAEAVEVGEVGGQGEHVGGVGTGGVMDAGIGATILDERSAHVAVAGPPGGQGQPVGHRSVDGDTVGRIRPPQSHVLAVGKTGQGEELTTHTNFHIGAGDEPVDVGLTEVHVGMSAETVSAAEAGFSAAPVPLAVGLDVAGELFGNGEGHADADHLHFLIELAVVEGGAGALGELEQIGAVHLHINGGSGSGRGKHHAGGQKKRGKLFHFVIPLKKVGR